MDRYISLVLLIGRTRSCNRKYATKERHDPCLALSGDSSIRRRVKARLHRQHDTTLLQSLWSIRRGCKCKRGRIERLVRNIHYLVIPNYFPICSPAAIAYLSPLRLPPANPANLMLPSSSALFHHLYPPQLHPLCYAAAGCRCLGAFTSLHKRGCISHYLITAACLEEEETTGKARGERLRV